MTIDAHQPVLAREVLELACGAKDTAGLSFLDATFGRGGHSDLILGELPVKTCILLDRDPEALRYAKNWIQTRTRDGLEFILKQCCFSEMKKVLEQNGLRGVDLVLLDLGVSSPQLDDPQRGFSFQMPGPLDMRMNPSEKVSAASLIAEIPEKDLADLLYTYGEERASRKIAKAIVEARKQRPIRDTLHLAGLIEEVLPRRGKIHPATRSFQALRIAVNKELQQIEEALKHMPGILNPGGRVLVISFHSLEDRMVKQTFRQWKKDGVGEVLTKKCIQASGAEVRNNPRSRSARLRCFARAA